MTRKEELEIIIPKLYHNLHYGANQHNMYGAKELGDKTWLNDCKKIVSELEKAVDEYQLQKT